MIRSVENGVTLVHVISSDVLKKAKRGNTNKMYKTGLKWWMNIARSLLPLFTSQNRSHGNRDNSNNRTKTRTNQSQKINWNKSKKKQTHITTLFNSISLHFVFRIHVWDHVVFYFQIFFYTHSVSMTRFFLRSQSRSIYVCCVIVCFRSYCGCLFACGINVAAAAVFQMRRCCVLCCECSLQRKFKWF